MTTFVVEQRVPWPDDTLLASCLQLETAAIYSSNRRYECSLRKVSPLGATVCTTLSSSIGDRVAVELGTGQRAGGSVTWKAGQDAGVCFDNPIDVLALINRTLLNQPTERRRMPRVELRCSVNVQYGGVRSNAVTRNISASGLQIEGEELPAPGTFVSLYIDGLVVPAGEVAWRNNNLAGIELFDELSWTSIVPWIRDTLRKHAH